MDYQQAIERTIRLQKFIEEYIFDANVKYIVVPANEAEKIKFLYHNPFIKDDQDLKECIKYCSDGNFSIYRLELKKKSI